MSVLKITNENFENEVLNSDKTTIVDFYADWCGPCKMMSPIIDKIAEENSNIKVGKLNVDNAQDIAVKYNVMSIPTIVVFKNGTEYKRFIGVTSKSDILNALN
jgi:thioredoxin 1